MANKKRFLLRLDPKVWAALQAEAEQNLRSVNGQIEFFLRQALRARLKTRDEERDADAST